MKYVRSNVLTYDANYGRIEPGEVYFVEDEVATRWANGGVASITDAPKAPPAEPEDSGDEDPMDDDAAEETDPEQLAADAQKLHDEGLSERAIAQELGVSRQKVHTLLSGKS